MPAQAIHATAVAIGGEALLIVGPSRSGKSRLAVALIARATRELPIALVGDDRILLQERDGQLIARPHPSIAGFLERRGLGIVAMDWVAEAPVGALIELQAGRGLPSPLAREEPAPDSIRGARRADEGAVQSEPFSDTPPHPPASPAASCAKGEGRPQRIPRLTLSREVPDPDWVLAWWAARGAGATHLAQSPPAPDWPCAKD